MITINEINMDDYSLRFPNSNEKYFNSMNDSQKTNYLKALSVYYYWLNCYIGELLGLQEYDQYFKDSTDNFKSVEPEQMDMYQKQSSNMFKYFYIRSNIYIEKMSNDELQFIIKKMQVGKFEYDLEVKDYIGKTFKKLIFESVIKENVATNFGPLADRFLVNNGTLVIGIRYDADYQSNLETDEQWGKGYIKREQQVRNAVDIMNYTFLDNSFPVKVVKYDEASVKKKI